MLQEREGLIEADAAGSSHAIAMRRLRTDLDAQVDSEVRVSMEDVRVNRKGSNAFVARFPQLAQLDTLYLKK